MKIIVLNHKMNLYYEDLDNYINKINEINRNIIIAPSNIYLLDFKKKCNHKISSQDICYIEEGNYTGKVSWHQIKSIGIKYSIIGHSEKNEDINKTNIKLNTCIKNDIKPILCFGEMENPIKTLDKLIKNIKSIDNFIFAYEPIKNINNKNINLEEIKKDIKNIYNHLLNKYKTKPILLYGGGINTNNIKEIYYLEELEGILIGSISSNIDEIKNILMKLDEK